MGLIQFEGRERGGAVDAGPGAFTTAPKIVARTDAGLCESRAAAAVLNQCCKKYSHSLVKVTIMQRRNTPLQVKVHQNVLE